MKTNNLKEALTKLILSETDDPLELLKDVQSYLMKPEPSKTVELHRGRVKSVKKLRRADNEYVYDIGMKNEKKPWLFGNNILLHNSVYFSAYPVFKKEIERGEFEWTREKIIELYDTVCEEVNGTFPMFMNRAFNVPELYGKVIAAGREVVASKGLFITKKRYAVLIFDKEGKRKDKDDCPGDVKAMGLDLKRSDTPDYMQEFLQEILLMVLTGQEQQLVLDKILEFRSNFKKKTSWSKGTPKRVNNLTNHTRVYEKTGKCGIGHALAAINWNRLRKANSDQYSLDIVDGMKTIVCKLKFNPLGMTSIGYPTDEKRLPEWFKELPFDDAEMEKAIIDAKVDNLIGVLNWPLENTRLDNNFADLFE